MSYIRGGGMLLWGQNQATSPIVPRAITEAVQIGYNSLSLLPYNQVFSNNDPLGARVSKNAFYAGSGTTADALPGSLNPEWFSDAQIATLMTNIHNAGMTILTKPMIDTISQFTGDHSPIASWRAYLDPGTAQVTGLAMSNGSNLITFGDSGVWPGTVAVGNPISGTNIPSGSVITAINGGRTQITISNNCTGTASGNYNVLLGSTSSGSTINLSSLPATLSVTSSTPFSSGQVIVPTSTGLAIIAYTGTGTNTLTGCSVVLGSGTVSNGVAIFANAAAVFQAYKTFIVHYATIAQTNYAAGDIFCIGCELNSMVNGQGLNGASLDWTPIWKTLIIPAVRAVFSGSITYAGYPYAPAVPSFWSALDYLGYDWYPGNSAPAANPWPHVTASTISGNNQITLLQSTGSVPLAIGDSVGGSGIAFGSTITNINGSVLTLSQNATATNTSGSPTTVYFGTTNVGKLQTAIRASIVSSLSTFSAANSNMPVLITETTIQNAQACCYGILYGPQLGPNEAEQAAFFQAMVQELESGSYSWYSGLHLWCRYHINDPIHWTISRKQSETGPLRNLWKLGNTAQSTLFSVDASLAAVYATTARNRVNVNSSTSSISPITGQAVIGSYWANPGDVISVTTGSAIINIYLPAIVSKYSKVTVTKVDGGTGNAVIAGTWINWVTSGSYDNGPSGHDLVNGATSYNLTNKGQSGTFLVDGSDYPLTSTRGRRFGLSSAWPIRRWPFTMGGFN